MVNFLLHKKQGYGEVVIVNLRNDMVIEFDEATYHVQDIGFLGEPVQVYGASGKDMEVSAHCLLPASSVPLDLQLLSFSNNCYY